MLNPLRRIPLSSAALVIAVAALACITGRVRAQSADRPAAAAHWASATRRVALENGLTVLMLQRGELPIVSVQALYRVGSRNEAPGATGAAHFVEHMAFRSTEGIAKRDLTNQVLRWGGRWNGYTSYDQTVYGSATPSRYLDWLIYLERQRMGHVVFADGEVDKERTSVIAELHGYENSPDYVLVEHRMRRAALVAHPYGSPIMGWISDLEGVTAAELERFYRDYYVPRNLILAIVGRFDPEEALALVRKHFGGAGGEGRSTRLRTVEPEQHGERRVTMAGPGSESHLEIAVHAPAASAEAFATLLVLDGVLAGGKASGKSAVRSGSRLHRALVESGLAAGVTTEIEASEYPGLYSVGIDAGPHADLHELERVAGSVFDEVARAVSPNEVERAARQIRAAAAYGADSNRAVANLLTVYEELASYTLLATLPERVARVTPNLVRDFAAARLAPSRRTIGTFVPQQATPAISPTPQKDLSAATGAPEARSDTPAPQTPTVETGTQVIPVAPPAPSLTPPRVPQPIVKRFANGLTASILPMAAGSVHIRVRVQAGAVYDPEGLEGTALLTARLLDAGTAGRAGREISRMLGDRSVRLTETATSLEDPLANRHFIEIAAVMLPEDASDVAQLLGDLVMKPTFPEDALRAARDGMASELEAFEDDSEWRAARAVFDTLFAAPHVYSRKVEGTPASIAHISREGLQRFHAMYFQPDRVTVSVAGAVAPEPMLEALGRSFGAWKAGNPVKEPATLAPTDWTPAPGKRLHVSLPHKEQASIAVGLPGVRRDDPDYIPLAALNYLLGETGYAGRLGETLVDTGIAYSVYATVRADRGPGPIMIATNAVRSDEAVNRMVSTLEGFARGGVSEAELREAKGYLLGRLLFRFESPTSATATLADVAYFGEAGSLAEFAERVSALTVGAVNAAATRYYDPKRAVIAVAGR